ncbi:hypothetical protein O6H91_13G015600 [Diphasiastrum complanatum]|uniref:Uncharacterized protein n=1 Tax=Diphasiastrum complanatum TaxID=34168 RepID=A0ACC2BSE9_DIPCM|nr:hypothetical protein O6H91_13G015600 [Diphasiastrum complanatum]
MKKNPNQIKCTCYAQTSQIRQIRKKMREIMVREVQSCDLKELVAKFIPEKEVMQVANALEKKFRAMLEVGRLSRIEVVRTTSCCRPANGKYTRCKRNTLWCSCKGKYKCKSNSSRLLRV